MEDHSDEFDVAADVELTGDYLPVDDDSDEGGSDLPDLVSPFPSGSSSGTSGIMGATIGQFNAYPYGQIMQQPGGSMGGHGIWDSSIPGGNFNSFAGGSGGVMFHPLQSSAINSMSAAVNSIANFPDRHAKDWDPSSSTDWDQSKASELCLGRIARDLHSLYTDPIPGILVHAFESDVTSMLSLICGPAGTPYEGGFFQFYLRCPPDYPISSPRVRLLTTGDQTVRFNPNLYANGKVCLSLLGTWSGPQWSPALNISSLLLSIQSLMSEFPYRNEPGYESVPDTHKEVINYNTVIRHETIRVAVIGQVEEALGQNPSTRTVPRNTHPGSGDQNRALPDAFAKTILTGFLIHVDKLIKTCHDNMAMHGAAMAHALGDRRGKYLWKDLLAKLLQLKSQVQDQSDMENKSKLAVCEDADGNRSD